MISGFGILALVGSTGFAQAVTVQFASSASSALESNATANVTVILTQPTNVTVTVDYAVTGGTATGGGVDYTLPPGTLTFNPGETSNSISLTLTNDAVTEADETVVLALSNANNAVAGPGDHTFTIVDDDPGVLFDGSVWYIGEKPVNRLSSSGLELNWTNPVAPDMIYVALPAQPLNNVGDIAQVSYLFKALGATNLVGGGDLRFALCDSTTNGFFNQEGLSYIQPVWTTYLGYSIRFSPYTPVEESPGTAQFRKRTDFGNGSLIQASGRWTTFGTNFGGFGVPNDTFVPLILRAERTGPSTVLFSVTCNGVTYSQADAVADYQPQKIDTLAIYYPTSKAHTNFALAVDPESLICTINMTANSSMRVGQTNAAITINTGAGLDLGTTVTVNLISTNPSVAVANGAAGGKLTVTFPAGRTYSSTNIQITGFTAGITQFYLTNATGAAGCGISTNANRNSAKMTVTCGTVVLTAPSTTMLLGQTNRSFFVSFDQGLNHASALSVDVVSAAPTVAVPQGAVAGKLTLVFPQGSANSATVPIDSLKAGTTTFYLTNLVASGCPTAFSTFPLTVLQPGLTAGKTENFDTTNSAYADGWREFLSRTNSAGWVQDYGFSDSGNAGGPIGEAGGTIIRHAVRSYYADRTVGRLTLNDRISANGTLYITQPATNATWHICHFNSTDVAANGGRNILGVSIADGAGSLGSPRIQAAIGLSNAGANPTVENTGAARLSLGDLTTWSYAYDPTGGTTGDGQQVLTYTTFQGTFSIANNLTAAQRATGATFDSFGILVRGSGNAATNDAMIAHIDSLTYTVGGSVNVQNIETLPGNQLRITFASAGTAHKVQQSSSVSPTSWSDVSGVTFAGPANLVWTAQFAMPASTSKFYRIVANPSP